MIDGAVLKAGAVNVVRGALGPLSGKAPCHPNETVALPRARVMEVTRISKLRQLM